MTNKLLNLESNNPKEFWNMIQEMRNWGDKKNYPADNIEPAKWVTHFKNLFKNNPEKELAFRGEEGYDILSKQPIDNVHFPVFTNLDYIIKEEEVLKAIKGLKKNKSPGLDNIISEFIIYGKYDLVKSICKLFNLVFRTTSYPKIWTVSYLKPVHKKDIISDPGNYRGIAVSSCLSKLFSLVLLNRLHDYVEKTKPLSINQIGFRKGKRTTDHIFVIKTLIDKLVREGKKIFIAFIDFKKAYDTINHKRLFHKLKRANIDGLFLQNLNSMYKSVEYCIKMQGGYADPIESFVGLKQGCVLSPLLFNLFIDDIKDIFDNTCYPVHLYDTDLNHMLYADDLIILSTTSEGLQTCLDKLEAYCIENRLMINIEKSKTMIFNESDKILKNYTFHVGGAKMELVQNFCNLGLDITASGSFHIAKSNLKDKGIKAMYPLIDTVIKFELKVEQSIDFFKRLISPILLYGSEIWSTLTQHQLKTISNDSQELGFYMVNANSETVHLKFLKIVMGLKRNTPSMAVLGDSGQYPVSVIAYLNLLKYWHRICHLDDSCLVKKALNETTSIPDSKCDWKATVKTILNICSMEDVWENPL